MLCRLSWRVAAKPVPDKRVRALQPIASALFAFTRGAPHARFGFARCGQVGEREKGRPRPEWHMARSAKVKRGVPNQPGAQALDQVSYLSHRSGTVPY
jgi:hypothetical protein